MKTFGRDTWRWEKRMNCKEGNCAIYEKVFLDRVDGGEEWEAPYSDSKNYKSPKEVTGQDLQGNTVAQPKWGAWRAFPAGGERKNLMATSQYYSKGMSFKVNWPEAKSSIEVTLGMSHRHERNIVLHHKFRIFDWMGLNSWIAYDVGSNWWG